MKSISSILCLIIVFFITLLLTGCLTNPREREEIIEWASQIALMEKQLQYQVAYYQPLLDKLQHRPPTSSELNQLSNYTNSMASLYNQIVEIFVPAKARSIHDLHVRNFEKISDCARYYVMYIKINDLSYYDKSVIAAQEANKLASDAERAFEKILNEYSISCLDINYCE